SSSSDGNPQSQLPHRPSLCRARFFPSPQFHGRKSRKYLQSASQTAYQCRAPAAECSCPQLPSIPELTSPTSDRLPKPSKPNRESPANRRQDIGSSSATRALPVQPI